MADVGYTQFSNDILDALLSCCLSGQEFQLALTVYRQTFGWHKRAACIEPACFMDVTGICRQNVYRGLISLVKKNIICRKNATNSQKEWEIQLDTSRWVCRRNATGRKCRKNATKSVAKTRQNGIPTILVKERRKERTPIVPLPEISSKKKTVSREPPPGINPDSWAGWLEMRSKKKAPWTMRSRTLTINKLERLTADGHSPEDVLDQSTFRGWTGLFSIKSEWLDGKPETDGFAQWRAKQGRKEKDNVD
jgi:phage replication O-like protein O